VHADLVQRHELLETVLQTAVVGIVAADAQGRLTMLNGCARDWHGLAEDAELAAVALTRDLYRADGVTPLPEEEAPLLRALEDGAVDKAEIVIAAPGREPVTAVCTGRRLVARDGGTVGSVVVMADVTERRQQEAALRNSQARFRSAFEQAPNPIAVASAEGVYLDVNPAFCAWLGWSRDELVGRPAVDLTHPDDRARRQSVVDAVLADEVATARLDRRYRHRNGEWLWGRMSLGAVRAPDGALQLISQVEDVTEQRAVEQRLTALALHDHLTGLANRSLLLERLQHAMTVAARDASVHALLFLDLDRFKVINDTHGHATGDEVLVQVARRLSKVVRPSDTVARLGGDEFVLLCESLTGWDQVEGIVARVRAAVERPMRTRVGTLTVGVSVGVARPGQDVAASIADADAQMYESKKERRAALPPPRRRPPALAV
jgi:diguanylate cyclase (GGDEF)-like protein/PAS domain S-box-containing protein